PFEAELMDPQERLVLEVCWETIEDSGYTPPNIVSPKGPNNRRSVGVFVGVMHKDYTLIGAERVAKGMPLSLSLNYAQIANRVSYFCNFNGPSMAIDTVCSSSVTAIHEAIESIKHGECDLALAGGVNLSLHPNKYMTYGMGNLFSTDGRCRTFAKGGDGYVSSEGVGAVLLKPLSRAISDHDHIYAVIKASGINHVGSASGITVPGPVAQAAMIASCCQKAGISPRTLSYIEAHGTGTKLGDPIEIKGLVKAFRQFTKDCQFCAIGSVKSNIGHSESAAGISGLTKTILQLYYKTLVPSLHAQELNPYIDFQSSPFYVQQQTEFWKQPVVIENEKQINYPRRAGVSSFGATGSNAHVILEEYIPEENNEPLYQLSNKEYVLIPLSAKNTTDLHQYAQLLLLFLQKSRTDNTNQPHETPLNIFNIACTLQSGRLGLKERIAFIVSSIENCITALDQFINHSKEIPDCYQGQKKRNISDSSTRLSIPVFGNHSDCEKSALLWVNGKDFEHKLSDGIQFNKVSLPVYPFEKQRYWLPEPETNAENIIENHVENSDRLLLTEPHWTPHSIDPKGMQPDYEQYIIFYCDPVKLNMKKLKTSGVQCIKLSSENKKIEKKFQDHAVFIFEKIQAIVRSKPKGMILIQIVFSRSSDHNLLLGLSGILKTAHLENPKIIGQVIALDHKDLSSFNEHILHENSLYPVNSILLYQSKQASRLNFQPIDTNQEKLSMPWKNNGTYLITGGAGGLGLIFAKEICHQVQNPTIILTGRSVLDKARQLEINGLKEKGANIIYEQINVTDFSAIKGFVKDIIKKTGMLNGVIHSAGVIHDQFIIKKTTDDFQKVLAPKVLGTVYLDKASKKIPLDFFILFSSGAGTSGNPGQADYAAANAFMDAYASFRNDLVDSGKRKGKTISINWPLWKEGGMGVDHITEQLMEKNTGMKAMKIATGLHAFYNCLAYGKNQVMVMEGDLSLMLPYVDKLNNNTFQIQYSERKTSHVDDHKIHEKTLHKLKEIFGKCIKLSVSKIDPLEEFENYGINSITIAQLNQILESVFGEISKTLFFEYQNLSDLAFHLVNNYKDSCLKWAGLQDDVSYQKDIVSKAVNEHHSINHAEIVYAQPDKHVSTNEKSEPIAIIGMSGRYPMANTMDEFWENIKTARNCISEIPEERWSLNDFYVPGIEEARKLNKSYSKWGGFIDGFAHFDALFFNISPKEAMNIDPQERLFLQCCWELFEDAGYTRHQIEKKFNRDVGVFVGITKTGFELYGPELWSQQKYPKTSFASIANRISYVMNLRGPSMPVDTMCSSSLTAIHEACKSLYLNECQMAIAGGVNLYLHPSTYVSLCAAQMLSSDGKCRSFGKGANGFVPGEGVGAVLLKKLSHAIADGDRILALIKGSAINHDGKTNGYTVPSPQSQGDVIVNAIKKADIDARSISYIEAHGTGTKLGDPIEITGLTKAFQEYTRDTQFCAIASIKSNMGHLEAAAGIAGIQRIVLQMNHHQLTPGLHARECNPNINFKNTPFVLQQSLSNWDQPEIMVNGDKKTFPRIAGISSFGAGGANAHVIIEEYPFPIPEKSTLSVNTKQNVIILLSAKNIGQLKNQARQLIGFIEKKNYSDHNLLDIAFTLQVGREPMDVRLAMIIDSMNTLLHKLTKVIQSANEDDLQSIEELYFDHVKNSKETLDIFSDDEDMTQTIERWIVKEKFSKLLKLWTKGLNIDWNKLYPDTKPFRISLPTYPFEKNRYWLFDPPQSISKNNKSMPLNLYLFTWEQSNQLNESIRHAKKIVIVYPESAKAFAKTIHSYVKKQSTLIFVQLSQKTKALSSNKWTINIHDQQALDDCLQNHSDLNAVFFLSEFFPKIKQPDMNRILDSHIQIHLLRLVKVLQKISLPIDLFVISQDHHHPEAKSLNPCGAGITGLAYSIAQSEQLLRLRNIDISYDDLMTAPQKNQLIQAIMKEPPSDNGSLVRLSNGFRYIQKFIPFDSKMPNTGLVKNGVYVILGGSGVVGMIISRLLIEKYHAHIVWIGRSPRQSIEHKIEMFRNLGNPPDYIQADVTDSDQIKHAVSVIKEKYSNINGAIFSGLVFKFSQSVSKTNEKDFLDVFDVKARGSLYFYQAFEKEKLDFMCFFSSTQSFSFSNAKESCAYAAGISFSDTLVRYLSTRSSFPVGTINWGFFKAAIEGTILVKNSGVLLDDEACLSFEKFSFLIQNDFNHQVLCFRLSEKDKKRINITDNEIFRYMPSSETSIHKILKTEFSFQKDQLKNLIDNMYPESLHDWFLKLLFVQMNQSNLLNKNNIIKKYHLWFDECINILEKKSFISQSKGKIIVHKKAAQLDYQKTWQKWNTTQSVYTKLPEQKLLVNLIQSCLKNLPDILKGNCLSTDILFPNASMKRVGGLYQQNPLSNFFNNSLADLVEIYVKQRIHQHQQKIIIIEIGAGTGGTSAAIFPKLQPYANIVEYHYTDISKSFLSFAQKTYGPKNPYIKYRLWNIEESAPSFDCQADIILATNVLHATKNIKTTLTNAKAALQANGILLINENIQKTIYATLTFGLLDGWWIYEDKNRRIPGSPLLTDQSWKNVLKSVGFKHINYPLAAAKKLGQQIIVAVSDGLIRQVIDAPKNLPQTCLKDISDTSPESQNTKKIPLKRELKIPDQTDQLMFKESHIQSIILSYLSEALQVDESEIDKDIPFSDYGVDSIIGADLTNNIGNKLNIEINTSVLYEYTCVARFTKYIVKELKAQASDYPDQFIPKAIDSTEDDHIQQKGIQTTIDSTEDDHIQQSEENTYDITASEKICSSIIAMDDDIAVIGMAGQFPDAPNIDIFWDNLLKEHNSIREVPDAYLDKDKYFCSQKTYGKSYCKWAGILEDKYYFDPLFFNIFPREAESMSVHQRLVLQESYKSLENAGYNPKFLSGSNTGIFIGAEPSDYVSDSFTGASDAIISSRLSYFLNLNGPALTVNTGCSSSGVAIHLACQSLRNHESDMAIAGGVSASLNHNFFIRLSEIEMISPTGKCMTFDKSADGTIVSEGVGLIVLKRLKQAIADKDAIYGVIKASGMNQDGASNGITAPNGEAQEKLITKLYKKFHINPEQISYIEAHGTGTRLGDPVEANALVRAFSHFTNKTDYCAIGSAKSFIGHTSAAAGAIGIIKVLLSMHYQKIPGLINFNQLNPLIQFQNSPFYVNNDLKDWHTEDKTPRMAALNCFGHSGTNVHFVLSDYIDPYTQQDISESHVHIIPISAKNKDSLKQYATDLSQWLKARINNHLLEISLTDIAFTLQTGRWPMNERLVLMVQTIDELITQLDRFSLGDSEFNGHYKSLKKDNQITGLFSTDNELTDLVQKWITQGNVDKVAKMWCQGMEIDWHLLYTDVLPNKVHLPTYSFVQKRYRKKIFLQKQWTISAINQKIENNYHLAILCSKESLELANEIAAHLKNAHIIDEQVLLSNDEIDQYDGCIDLIGCGKTDISILPTIKWIQKQLDAGINNQWKNKPIFLSITKGLESFDNHSINVSGASRAALYRMLQCEYHHIRSCHVDIDSKLGKKTFVQHVLAELHQDSDNTEICYRNGKRYRAEIQEFVLPKEKSFLFPDNHVLWITGGTRGLGYLCAEHFVRKYHVKKLVLHGRESFPSREQWDDKHSESITQKINLVRALEKKGVDIMVVSTPLTNEKELTECLKMVKVKMGPIGGLLHCAGIIDGKNPAFIRKTIESISSIFAPKITGLNNLYKLFKHENLACFVVFSSVSAIIPKLASGQIDYAISNAYMDYFAESVNSSCPVISIQWPNWKQTGMGENKTAVYSQTGFLSHTDSEGLQLLDDILEQSSHKLVLAAICDPSRFNAKNLLKSEPKKPAPTNLKEKTQTFEKDDIVAVQEYLVSLFSKELKVDPSDIEVDITFQDYGVDSILLAQVFQSLNKELAEELDPSILYEHPSISVLAKHLLEGHANSLSTVIGIKEVDKSIIADVSTTDSQSMPLKKPSFLSESNNIDSDIAVVGMSCRFPGANTVDEYWELLSQGKSSIAPVKAERWGYQSAFHAALVENITNFDTDFFLIPKEDVPAMDPQALILLEESLKLFYHAGYSHHDIKGKQIGVYIGGRSHHRKNEINLRKAKNPIACAGQNYLSANISHFFDLKGPCLVLDTACSSALVGMSVAINSLNAGEIESAIVGGVSILDSDGTHRLFEQRNILCKDSVFHVYDQRASGVILGEGAGLVLLKQLDQAIKDNDRIYAVIKSLSINNDGRTAGPATPNIEGQKLVLQTALKKRGLSPDQISYIEGNASGTLVTDLLELKAIQSVYRPENNSSNPLSIGSIKPNIGHPLIAESIASFIKVSLMIYHQKMIPFLSGEHEMRHFDIKSSPFYFCRKTETWNHPQLASVNSFGDGGTNAHAILSSFENKQGESRQSLKTPALNKSTSFSGNVCGNPWKT
ncbi:polyketide synthase, partial [Candidatus Magnetomorum sp. HK-1]